VVALSIALLVTFSGVAAVYLYAKRRPVGAPLTWGEAMAAAAFVFFISFLAYGVAPHQWLSFADNELSWRADKILLGPGDIVAKLPFTVTYRVLRDLVVVVIYGVMLGVHVGMWVWWQKRGEAKPKEIETSPYGRPLVRKA
jgi:hypothetical protein